MDRLGQWITEWCVLTPAAKVKAAFAYQDYRKWADERGEYALTLTGFGNRLTERGIQKLKGRTVVYLGIGLCDTSATVTTDSQVFSSRAIAWEEQHGKESQVSEGVANHYLRASRGD